jgi:hypothetical protein
VHGAAHSFARDCIMRPARSGVGGTTTVVIIALALLMIGTIGLAMQTSQSTSSSSSSRSSTSPSSVSAATKEISWPSPFTGAGPIAVRHETCEITASEFSSTCSSSTYNAGIPQSFNMTTAVHQSQSNQTAVTVFSDYFAVAANQGDTVAFSMKSTNNTTFLGYFDAGANASSASSLSALSDAGTLFVKQTGNYQTYSGNVTAPQDGAYVFVFSVPAPEFNDSVTFLLMDSSAYNTGLSVKVGATEVQEVTISQNVSSNGDREGFAWYMVPITVYAPSTTSVNLTSLTLNEGGWLKIIPSYLPAVGPQGANATIYMAGIGPVTTQLNNSLFIGASGADGLTGDAVIPIEGSSEVNVITGPGPVSISGGGLPYIVGLVYDPSSGTAASLPSLPVTISIGGVLDQNGSVVPLPSWLNVTYPEQHFVFGNGSTIVTTTTLGPGATFSGAPEYETDNVTTYPPSSTFSFVLQPYNPYFFVLTVDGSSAPKADQGMYTVVLNETVGGQHFVSYLKVDAIPFLVQRQGFSP